MSRLTHYSLAVLAALPILSRQTACATEYLIDPDHTHPSFEINHLGLSTFRARFDRTSGTVELDRRARTGAADVTIDVQSISTGVADLDEDLKSPNFFDAARFPTMRFKSTHFEFDADRLSKVVGELTMHGITKPVSLQVHALNCKTNPINHKPTCGVDASAVIRRSDWQIVSDLPLLGDDVSLKIEIEAAAQ